MRLFCFGLGYVAQHVSALLREKGWQTAGTSRVGREGVFTLDDGTALSPEALQFLDAATHVLISIPPGADGQEPAFRRYAERLGMNGRLQWLGYLSTTGVYGDYGGEWVDESSPLKAVEPRSIARIQAERTWLEWGIRYEKPAHIFRLAGIYGPGRNVLSQIREGKAQRVVKEGQYFSRIHVEDIAQALLVSIAKSQPGVIYNVCDDLPAPSHEVVAYGCHLLGMEPPPIVNFSEAALSPMARSFYAANRRVRNDAVKSGLALKLHYPTYREGLGADFARLQQGEG